MSDLYLKPKMLQICIVGRDCERLNANWGKMLSEEAMLELLKELNQET